MQEPKIKKKIHSILHKFPEIYRNPNRHLYFVCQRQPSINHNKNQEAN